jgi:hypothetical protein
MASAAIGAVGYCVGTFVQLRTARVYRVSEDYEHEVGIGKIVAMQ